jgi:hypothetical protein
MVFPHAGHVFTVATYHRLASTGFQVIFSDMDSRTVDVNHTQVVYGTGHFAQMTAAAVFGMYPNLHYVTQVIGVISVSPRRFSVDS